MALPKELMASINILLSCIGQEPVQSDTELENTFEAQRAKEVLDEVRISVLNEGWGFNTDKEWEFHTDINGYIPIPENALTVFTNCKDIVIRNHRLYNKAHKTFIFKKSILANVIWDMDFNELSYAIRNYITIRAGRLFALRTVTDGTLYQFSANDEILARREAKKTDNSERNLNLFFNYDEDIIGLY